MSHKYAWKPSGEVLLKNNDSELQVLVDLGLTRTSAKVYLALSKSGPLKTLSLAKIAEVARPDTYRELLKLRDLGLVEQIFEKPMRYRAIPINKGLSLLLKERTAKYKRIRAATEMWIDQTKKENLNNNKLSQEPQLVLIPEGETIIGRIRTAIEEAESSINLLLSFRRFSRGIVNTFADSIEIAWEKNVKTRFLVEQPSESETSNHLIQFCNKKPSSEVRLIPYHPETVLGIYDKQELFLITNPKTDLPGSSALWTSNSGIIALATDHFGCLWSSAVKTICQRSEFSGSL